MYNIFNSFSVEKFEENSGKQFDNAVFANGIFRRRKVDIGTFVTQVQKADMKPYGLTVECEPSFTFDHTKIPKIPVGVLNAVITLYKNIAKTIRSEVYCAIVWDKVKQDFFIHVPVQEVAAASIDYENTKEIYDNQDLVVVMDIHSHCDFGAFFSSTDLKDETGTRFFGVIGKVLNEQPEMVCRASTNCESIDLSFEQIFDLTLDKLYATSDYEVPDSDYDNVTEYVPKAVAGKPGVNSLGYSGKYYAGQNWVDFYDDAYYDNYSTTKTTSTGNYAANPFNKSYTLLNTVRYAKKYSEETALNYLSNSLECIAKFVEETNASNEEIRDMIHKFDEIIAKRMSQTMSWNGTVASGQTLI